MADLDTHVASLVSWSQDVRAALRRLDPMQRRVVRLVYFEHRTTSQVADQLRLPRAAVSRSLAAGLQALTAALLVPQPK